LRPKRVQSIHAREDERVIIAWANGAVKRVIITAVVVVDG
jgi:hypothetical protein